MLWEWLKQPVFKVKKVISPDLVRKKVLSLGITGSADDINRVLTAEIKALRRHQLHHRNTPYAHPEEILFTN